MDKNQCLTTIINNLIQNLASGNINPSQFYDEVKSSILPIILNTIMKEEREIHLQHNQNDYANGFHNKTLFLNQQPIDVKVPRTRSSNFFPTSIPKYSRIISDEYSNLIESLLLSSKSLQSLKLSLKKLNLPYSEEELEKIMDEILTNFNDFIKRELHSDWLIISIDAKKIEVKDNENKVKKGTLFTALGTNMEGKKEVLSSPLFYGDENLQMWKEVLLDLKNRGVTRCLLFITDNFSGIVKLINGLFPLSYHQLCLVHLIKNAKLHLSKHDFELFQESLNHLQKVNSFDDAYNLFLKLIDSLKSKHPNWTKELNEKAENYLTFTKFPKELRSRIKSTNQSENINKELERIRINRGDIFKVRGYCLLNGLFLSIDSKKGGGLRNYLMLLHKISLTPPT
ncbi:MAG: IS256 family transposase [Chitinispirillaceae bacterium]|nr:IS256 family transposase [Chitinispirillaceae bacterium]